MKIYINEQLIKSEVLPLDTPTLDETLETFSFALKAVPTAIPYASMQAVRIEMENQENDVLNLVLVSDSVTTFSLNPLRYKHSITCVQNTRKLSKHQVRNSVFSQPSRERKIATLKGHYAINSVGYAKKTESLKLDSREKIWSAKLKLETIFCETRHRSNDTGSDAAASWNKEPNTKTEISSEYPSTNFTFFNKIIIRYQNLVGVEQTPYEIVNDNFAFNQEYDLPIIKTLVENGCKNIRLDFVDDPDNPAGIVPPIDGVVTDEDDENSTVLYAMFYVFHYSIIVETYYNSAYDVLNLLAERQRQEDSRYSKKPLFSLPESGELHDLLVSTVAPNFTFTQLTMYECVAEVFRLFDAIFTMDEDGELGIEYFNDYNKEPLENPKFVGRQLSLSEDKYTNGLVSYYQDGRIVKTYPEHDSFTHLRSERLGVPDESDHSFIVPKPIHNIINSQIAVMMNFDYQHFYKDYHIVMSNPLPIEIGHRILDEEEWSVLSVEQNYNALNSDDLVQGNTIYFSKNSNAIKCGYSLNSTFGVTYYAFSTLIEFAVAECFGLSKWLGYGGGVDLISPLYFDSGVLTWNDIKMKVTYVASLDGRVKVESIENKYEGETLVDQVNGAVDLNKLGLNMLGLSLKMGEPTLNAAHRISTWDKRIKTGDIYQYEGGTWVANVCAYTFVGDHIQGNISFVKNFNSLALRTQLFREKRVSNISRELTIKSEDNYIEYCYYTTDDSVVSLEHYQEIAISKDNLSDGFLGSLGMSLDYKLGFGSLKTGRDITIGLFPTVTIPERIYIDLSVYGAGNMLCFEFAFDSPINAGNRTVFVESEAWFGSDKYFTSAVKYTDEAGFMDTASIEIIKGDRKFDFDTNFPTIIESNPGSRVYNDFLEIPELRIYKQPNEIFALNYEICFLPYPTRKAIDFIGSAFINKNFFTEGESFGRTLYFYYADDDFKYSILDTEGHGTKQAIGDVTRATVNNYFKITFWHGTILTAYKNWAVCDENGKILFASNTGAEAGSISRDIFFVPRHNRLS